MRHLESDAKNDPYKTIYEKLKAPFYANFKENNSHPIFLRMAFHDAGTYNHQTKEGGANGSLRFQLKEDSNKGLEGAFQFIE